MDTEPSHRSAPPTVAAPAADLPNTADLPNSDVRRELGQRLRARLPRGAHAHWAGPAAGRDLVALVRAADAGRIPALLRLRHERMAADPLAFLRGSAGVMAADLAGLARTDLLAQSCGDAHLMNFGTYISAEGWPVFDINDFDETLAAPFEWDLKRLAASLAVAAGVRTMPAKAARGLARRAAHAYRQHIDELASLAPLDAWRSRIDLARAIDEIGDRDVRRHERHHLADAQAASTAYRALVASDGRLRVPAAQPSTTVVRLESGEATARAAFAAYESSLSEERRMVLTRYRLRDVAFKVVGVGSVGTFCALGLFASGDDDVLILQLKEARESVLAAYLGDSAYADQGQRIVTGQRIMQASADGFLGWAHIHPEGRHFYVRQLKDSRMASIGGHIAADSLRFYAQLCGRTLARAHARSGDAARISGYLGDADSFDEAIGEFACRYAEQTVADHAEFRAALHDGRLGAGAPADAERASPA